MPEQRQGATRVQVAGAKPQDVGTGTARVGRKALQSLGMREGDVLRTSAFQRRLLVDYGPPIGEVYVHSPEDLILYKLMYLGLSGQPKHARDISAILRSKKGQLDFGYIEEWVDQLGLGSVWEEILDSIA